VFLEQKRYKHTPQAKVLEYLQRQVDEQSPLGAGGKQR
jgi:hypothetical protein